MNRTSQEADFPAPIVAEPPLPPIRGTVGTSPGLSVDFRYTFDSRYVHANGLRQHVVVGGQGPAILLVHGWPQNWFAWRRVMWTLARNHTVIVPDQRGMGLSDKPESGYDTGTLAKDLASLMHSLGHERFSVVGHDTGMAISYALAADFPHRVERVALAEVPGLPGVVPSPPAHVPAAQNNRLWHIPFNRVEDIPEKLVAGREAIFFGYEFEVQGGVLPEDVTDYYIRGLSAPGSLRGSFGFYRDWDATLAQNITRAESKLRMPVLAIGGEASWNRAVGIGMKNAAEDVKTAVIPGAAHWVAEQAPGALVTALTAFLRSN
ncbi:alpha/beta hydrolase [Streptomyces sp. NPDC006173]|uniref:alpha/beta fold hydrolase n=1 Tax=Streptomyces sp. NPDC006173 TaxID=3155349 RepID=UPI0033C7B67B